MNLNTYDKKSFAANIAKAINNAYQKGRESYEDAAQSHEGDSQAPLSLTPTQSTRTSSPEITPANNKSSDVQSRIDSLSSEDKALFNKFAVNYLEDNDDVVNRMTRAVVNNYPQVFPDLYYAYSTLYTNKSTAPNIENASQRPVSEQESPISAPYAVANPSTGIPITTEDIKYVITELAVKPFDGKAVVGVDWKLDEIADTILTASNQYKVDPRLALSQGIIEGHFGANPDAGRIRRTKNFYNVGNVDSGKDRYFSSYSDGIREYAELMNREYNWGDKDSWVTPEMMIENDFTRSSGQGRYARDPNYTNVIQQILKRVDNKLAERYQGRRMVLVPNDNNNTGRIE